MAQPQQQPPQQPTQWGQPVSQPLYQPQQQPQQLTPDGMASIDYLNQIATPKKNRFSLNRTQTLMLGGVLIVLFGILMVVLLSRSSGPSLTAKSQHFVARTAAITEVTKQSQKNIKSRDLSTLNSSLTIQMASAQSSLTEVFTEQGINTSKLDKKVLTAESNTALLDKLNDARLSGIFDRVYSREMSYELQNILITLKEFHSLSSNSKTKEQFESIYNNLEPLKKQIDEFSGATS